MVLGFLVLRFFVHRVSSIVNYMSILLLESIHEDAVTLLTAFDQVRLAQPDQELEAASGDVQAVLTRGRGRITAALMDRCAVLRVVARCGVGLDNIDVAAARERSISVIYAPGSTTQAVAEHTFALMLALARRVVPLVQALHNGNWAARDGYSGFELHGKTIGIVGIGAIGRRVAQLAEAFGMRVVYWSRSSTDARYERRTFDDLLGEADVVSLHTALTPETRNLIGAGELARMKTGALLINTARGAVVDQRAVLVALRNGQLGGYAADVLEQEPPTSDDPLLRHERALITPHIAAITDVTYRTMCVRTANNVLAILRGEQPEVQAVYR